MPAAPQGGLDSMTPSIFRPRMGSVALDAIRIPGPKGLWYSMTPSKPRRPSAPFVKSGPRVSLQAIILDRALAAARAARERPQAPLRQTRPRVNPKGSTFPVRAFPAIQPGIMRFHWKSRSIPNKNMSKSS